MIVLLSLLTILRFYNCVRYSAVAVAFSALTLLVRRQEGQLPFFGTILVSWYQKGKTDLDFTEARDSEWQWHQLGHCHSLSLHLAPDR